MYHRMRDHHHDSVAVLSWDYAFLSSKGHKGDEDRDAERSGQNPVLCIRDRKSGACFWYLVPFKGCDFPAFNTLVKRIVRNLISLGYKRAAFRSDGEPAIQAVMNAVIQAWPGEVIPEQSAEGDHSSNGNAEGGVSIMKGHVRTCKIALEKKIGMEIPETHPLLSWLVY